MKKRGEIKKFAYVQNWGTYQVDTIVVIGKSHDEIVEYMKKIKACKSQVETFAKCKQELAKCYEQKGFFWKPQGHGAPVLWLPKWEDSWEYYETLLHELHHGVHFYLKEHRAMGEEMEAQAYQQEYLFRSIRRRLTQELTRVEKRLNRPKLSTKR